MMPLDENYWTERYHNQHTGWDLGKISPPIQQYVDQLTDKNISILIPGAGNAYEAAYLYQQGFHSTYVLDISLYPLRQFQKNYPDFPKEQLLHQNFFELEGNYDLILEQTFFCALQPDLRGQYVNKMLSLLKDGGKLVGVLFDDPLFEDHPPFGGNKSLYLTYFKSHFQIITFERCYNSIKPRQGRELFMIMEKTKT
ncbi:methyltransferase domain-containing protein [Porifericola rhodea]|uniref:methyltransferase domain-containing protein n=1 Tax=Porifericola rhodea TaxID=930972 RepID=UPI0026652C4F|nr:methyltransferase domain-containing protein [Porifericola rhodea]WKN30469.1 methyltransferase domain-containing protein [Porifericola rhodea]